MGEEGGKRVKDHPILQKEVTIYSTHVSVVTNWSHSTLFMNHSNAIEVGMAGGQYGRSFVMRVRRTRGGRGGGGHYTDVTNASLSGLLCS